MSRRSFEEQHGNEDTFREMLRVQRSVSTAFAQAGASTAQYIAAQLLQAQATSTASVSGAVAAVAAAAPPSIEGDAGEDPAAAGLNKRKFVSSSAGNADAANDEDQEEKDDEIASKKSRINQEEIDI